MLLDVASDFSSDMRRDSILPLRFATWRARPDDAGRIPAMDKVPAREVSPGVEVEKAFPLASSAAAVAPASTERLTMILCSNAGVSIKPSKVHFAAWDHDAIVRLEILCRNMFCSKTKSFCAKM